QRLVGRGNSAGHEPGEGLRSRHGREVTRINSYGNVALGRQAREAKARGVTSFPPPVAATSRGACQFFPAMIRPAPTTTSTIPVSGGNFSSCSVVTPM